MNKVFCPKCKSTDVRKEMDILLAMGTPQKWVCNKCGYYGFLFPEKEIKVKAKKK
jgi:transposase-like protein